MSEAQRVRMFRILRQMSDLERRMEYRQVCLQEDLEKWMSLRGEIAEMREEQEVEA